MTTGSTTSVVDQATVPCLICDAANPLEAILCTVCGSPMALTYETRAQKRDPCIVTVVGDSNVGKTVYLGMLLDMLSRRADDFEAVPIGAYSVNLQHAVISYLGARHFPPKTAIEVDEWHWAYHQVSQRTKKAKVLDLVMPDMAGEALAAEVSSPNTFTVIRSLLEKSNAAILLVDAAMAAAGSPQPDFFALKLMTYLDGIRSARGKKRQQAPVAVVLSKADYAPTCFDNPRGFAETNLNRLWNFCNSRIENFEFFGCSVVGALGYGNDESGNTVPYPLHIAPKGVLEPFEWILSKLK